MKVTLEDYKTICVAGESFYRNNIRMIYEKGEDNPSIELIREPNNPYDTNAIKVMVAGLQVGHIEREAAKLLAPFMDKGNEINIDQVRFKGKSVDECGIYLDITGQLWSAVRGQTYWRDYEGRLVQAEEEVIKLTLKYEQCRNKTTKTAQRIMTRINDWKREIEILKHDIIKKGEGK